MYPLFESIKILNGKPYNLEWHERRLFRSCIRYFGEKPRFSLSKSIKIPQELFTGTVKLKVFYNSRNILLRFFPYSYRDIKTLKVVIDNNIDYSMKYTNRSRLTRLLNLKGECDEILIVKNGFITDTSFSNIVFFDGKNWITPSTPLLKGTCRERLLNSGKIIETPITLRDIQYFTHFKLINAFRELDETEEIEITNIKLTHLSCN